METIVITPRRTKVSLPIPTSYVGKSVMVTFSLKEEFNPAKPTERLSDMFCNVFSKEDAESFIKHTKTMREEWDDI